MVILLALVGCLSEDRVLAHYDRDGDGYPHPIAAEDQGYAGELDCDDAVAAVNPGAAEACDAVDNDCDGQVDEGDAAPGTFFADSDGDGHGDPGQPVQACAASAGQVASSDDCDDADGAVHPGAGEIWYDGVDQDCAGDDDDDADGDGHASDGHGGDDCDDDDPSIYDGAPESWLDVGLDNDCDGTTDDQLILDAGAADSIHGVGANAAFGTQIVVLPAGSMSAEPVVVVTAPAHENYRGAVYAWRASDLAASASTDDAGWTWLGGSDALMGYAVGAAGDAAEPVFLISEVATEDGTGTVHGWVGAAIGADVATTTFRIRGEGPGVYVGGNILSDTDLDGDGVDDLVVQAILDSQEASNAGTVGVFFDPAGLSGDLVHGDADALFTITEAGAGLNPVTIGDADNDGNDDLGFEMPTLGYPSPSGAVYLGVPATGQHDVLAEAHAVLYACGPAAVTDQDGDGSPELLATGGGVHQFDLPASGALYPWEDAVVTSGFADAATHWVGGIEPRLPFWDGQRILATSWVYDNERGAVALDRLRFGIATEYDDAKYLVLGDNPGDLLGMSFALTDADADGVTDLLLGAPGYDAAEAGAGALYVLPGPR